MTKQIIMLIVATLLVTGQKVVAANSNDVIRLTLAQYSEASSKHVSNMDNLEWKTISLPFKISLNKEVVPYLIFRIPIDHLDNSLDSSQAIYLSHHAFDIEVYIDQYKLGGKTNDNNKAVMGWNTPLLISVPHRFEQAKEIIVVLRNDEPFSFLPDIHLGDRSTLKRRFDIRYFSQVKATEWGWLTSLILGFFTLFLWRKRPSDKQYIQFSILCFSWSIVLLYMFLPYSPFEHSYWLKLAYFSAQISGCSLFYFINTMMKFEHQRIEKALIYFMGFVFFAYLLLPLQKMYYLMVITHITMILLVSYSVIKTFIISYTQPSSISKIISFGSAIVAAFVSFDVIHFILAHEGSKIPPEFTLMQHGILFLLITFFLLLIKRFIEALDSSEILSNNLEKKVKEVTSKLEKSHEESRRAAIAQSIEKERQKIMRDLHDDIGAKLISISSSSDSIVQAELGREALISMKDIISQSNNLNDDINSTVITATTEMEDRFRIAKITVDIDADKTLDKISASPQTCYHLNRIMREIATNIIKHSQASRVTIHYRFTKNLELNIRDNGVGIDMNRQLGNGILNIEHRVDQVNGALKVISDKNSGVSITLTIPLT